MFHNRHQAFYQAQVPPLREPWVDVVHAGQDGWSMHDAQWVNTAANLLFSALPSEHPLVGLLRTVPIKHHSALAEPPNDLRQTPAWYYQGTVYVNELLAQNLLLVVEGLSHELEHARGGHDQLPPKGQLVRHTTRSEWEVATHTAELEINSHVHGYLASLIMAASVPQPVVSGWLQEMIFYRLNADKMLAYHRMILAIARAVELLCEATKYDASAAADSSQSKIGQLGQYLADKYVVELLPLDQLAAGLAYAQQRIAWFNLPPQLEEAQGLATALTEWEKQLAMAQQAERQKQHQRTLFECLN